MGRVNAINELRRLGQERHARDVETGAGRGLWFCESAANHVCAFVEGHCRHVKGELRGRLITLEPWLRDEVIRPLFGWMRLPEGLSPYEASRMSRRELRRAGVWRRFRTAYIEVPRKNGKSTIAAALLLYLLILDGEGGGEVFAAGTKRDQAKIVFNVALSMARMDPVMRKHCELLTNQISHVASGSILAPLSADANTLDGLNISALSGDELHKWTRALWDVLRTASGARKQPLLLGITTAGDDVNGVGFEQREYSEKVLKGVVEDDSYFPFIATLDDGDDWRDPSVWAKANPNWGVSVSPTMVRDAFEQCQGKPGEINAFKRYYLNVWVNAAEAWLEIERWTSLADVDFDRETLAGRRCFLGLDLSRTTDLTAMAAVFPPTDSDAHWRVLGHLWTPEASLDRRGIEGNVPYRRWADQGWLTATPGNVVDYEYVADAVRDATRTYDVVGIGYDPYNATKFVTDLQAGGVEQLVEVRQGPPTLSGPMKELERLILEGRLRHDGNPLATWCVSNCVAKQDSNGNICPDKSKSRNRIDYVSALVTAMRLACVDDGEPDRIEYDGLMILG